MLTGLHNNRLRWCRIVLFIFMLSACPELFAQIAAEPDRTTAQTRRAEHHQLVVELGKAQRNGDEKLLKRLADKTQQLLGADAGVPETPDRFRHVPPTVARLSKEELPKAFDNYLREIERRKWWTIEDDPTKSDHKPREAASVIIGCCSAYRADCNNRGN